MNRFIKNYKVFLILVGIIVILLFVILIVKVDQVIFDKVVIVVDNVWVFVMVFLVFFM